MSTSVLSFRRAGTPPAYALVDHMAKIRERLSASERSGRRVFRFDAEDSGFATPSHIVDAVCEAARDGRSRRAPLCGLPDLREALAAKVCQKNGIRDVEPDDVFVTNGASHGLFVSFRTILQPGDEVLVPDPMWPGVGASIRMAGGEPVGVALQPRDGYAYLPEAVEAEISPRTRCIYVSSPHNPTGAVLSKDALVAILDVAQRHDLWVVSDETYEDVVFAPLAHHSVGALEAPAGARVLSVFSLSVSHAMAGLRTGYVVCRAQPLQQQIRGFLRATSNGVDVLAQWGALAAVTGDQSHVGAMRHAYRAARNLLMSALERIPGMHPVLPRGAFYVWTQLDPSIYTRLQVHDARGLSSLLSILGIGSAPGVAFGERNADALRFSFCCSPDMVCRGAAALRQVLA